MRFFLSLLVLALAPAVAEAGKWLDYLRKYDLNDYGLGLAVTTTQNPYVGAENSTFAYPYLTSFTHPALSDNWFVVRNGGIEARRITASGWEFGVAGRIQTLGFGNHDSEELRGVSAPKWGIELGPVVGLRRWPVQVHVATLFEPTDRHDGTISNLSLSYPMSWSRGYLVPSVAAVYQDSKYTEYYYAVSAEEATATRPQYSPGAAVNSEVKVSWGYQLSDNWLLSGKFSVENLADEIRNSPIVGRKQIWSANLGLAYDADVFNPSSHEFEDPDASRFDFRFGLFNAYVDTKIGRETSGGVPGEEIDLEDLFGESDRENVVQLDAVWRIGRYHRLEAGYFELVRHGSATIPEELDYGETVFAAGTDIESRSHIKSLRVGYAYSLLLDSQKELSVTAGIHFSSFESIITSMQPEESDEAKLEAPLPVVGLHGSINLGEKMKLAARLQFFRTDFDHFEGSLNYFTIDLQRRVSESINLGIGYNYYYMNLHSSNKNLNGYLKIQHRGPVIFLGYDF